MKRARVLAALLVVFVLIAGVVVLAVGRVPGFAWLGFGSTSCDVVQSVAPEPAPGPPGGGIRVVEQGFTQPTDEFNSVSLGAVLENSSDRIAYHTRVVVQILDRDKLGIADFETAEDEIPILMPGQRIGVGMTISPTRVDAASREVAAFTVSAESTRWVPRDALGDDFAPVTAEYRRIVRNDPKVPHGTEIRFVPVSAGCRALVGWNPAVLFRDGDGAIVGGTRQYVFLTEACNPNGTETWVVPRKATPPAADDRRTELYPYCDVR